MPRRSKIMNPFILLKKSSEKGVFGWSVIPKLPKTESRRQVGKKRNHIPEQAVILYQETYVYFIRRATGVPLPCRTKYIQCSLVPFRISKCSPVPLKEIIMFPGNFFVKCCTSNAQYMMQNIQFLLHKRIIASFTN